jgi:hypothetical protein
MRPIILVNLDNVNYRVHTSPRRSFGAREQRGVIGSSHFACRLRGYEPFPSDRPFEEGKQRRVACLQSLTRVELLILAPRAAGLDPTVDKSVVLFR